MNFFQIKEWETLFCKHLDQHLSQLQSVDASHDLAHVKRVAQTAQMLCVKEGGDLAIVTPAVWFHDYVIVPKNDPRRSQASRMSAQEATGVLSSMGYPAEYLSAIAHAIEAHSFSAQIHCRTLEARVVQDADRLDALGAIGLARLFNTSGQMGSRLYQEPDPFAQNRSLDDRVFALDHIFKKLYPIVTTLQTDAGRQEGLRRKRFLEAFVDQLAGELGMNEAAGKELN